MKRDYQRLLDIQEAIGKIEKYADQGRGACSVVPEVGFSVVPMGIGTPDQAPRFYRGD